MVSFLMDWQGFLEDFSDRVLRLTPEQREVFLARLDEKNREDSDVKVAGGLQLGISAWKKRMNAVYAAAERVFPELQGFKGRGKLEKLRGCLKEYKRQQAPRPPSLGEQESWVAEVAALEVVQSPPVLGDLGGEGAGRSTIKPKTGLKPGAPRVRLPENFVARDGALNEVKGRLLQVSERALVVSAIAGLGGLGKSVLATAIVFG